MCCHSAHFTFKWDSSSFRLAWCFRGPCCADLLPNRIDNANFHLSTLNLSYCKGKVIQARFPVVSPRLLIIEFLSRSFTAFRLHRRWQIPFALHPVSGLKLFPQIERWDLHESGEIRNTWITNVERIVLNWLYWRCNRTIGEMAKTNGIVEPVNLHYETNAKASISYGQGFLVHDILWLPSLLDFIVSITALSSEFQYPFVAKACHQANLK